MSALESSILPFSGSAGLNWIIAADPAKFRVSPCGCSFDAGYRSICLTDDYFLLKRKCIRAYGFFLVGSPGETEEDIKESFRFAARLKLDTFGFNRLCVYRGTPLWQEYIEREIIDDERDWFKWFKCSDIDPTILPSEVVNRARMKGYALLFFRRIFGRPIQTYRLVRTFGRYMKASDIFKLLSSPFRRRTLTRKPELPARMIDLGLKAPDRETVFPAA